MATSDAGSGVNSIELDGTLTEREAVRFTPAGIEVFEAVFHHRSRLVEAGHTRTLECDFNAIAFGGVAKRLNALPLGEKICLKGFLAPRSVKSKRLTVHITEFN